MADSKENLYLPQISLGSVLTILGGIVSAGVFLVALGGWKADLVNTNIVQDLKIDAQAAKITDIQLDQKSVMRKLNSIEGRLIVIDERLASGLPVKKADLGAD